MGCSPANLCALGGPLKALEFHREKLKSNTFRGSRQAGRSERVSKLRHSRKNSRREFVIRGTLGRQALGRLERPEAIAFRQISRFRRVSHRMGVDPVPKLRNRPYVSKIEPNRKRRMSAAEQIRYHRQNKKISLRSLAKEAGMSASSLSKIESGKAKLTVEIAVKLAGILHVPAALFLLEGAPQALARRTITRSGAGEVHNNPGMSLEVLCSEFKEKRNLFWKVKVTAKSIEECGGMRQHPGQEFLYILTGTLEIHTAFYDTCTLKTGDSILFDADQPHAYVAPDGDCDLVMMNSISTAS